jgi:hypothetical protein
MGAESDEVEDDIVVGVEMKGGECAVTGMRVPFCVGDGGCASWCRVQVRVVKLGCSSFRRSC